MLPDGDLRADDFTAEKINDYPMIVLPDCWKLTQNQACIVLDYARKGGRVLIYGRLDESGHFAKAMRGLENVLFVCDGEPQRADIQSFLSVFDAMYDPISVLACGNPNLGLQRCDGEGRTVVHILNYAYNTEKDVVLPERDVEIMLRDVPGRRVNVFRLDGESDAFDVRIEDDILIVRLHEAGVYSAVVIE